MGDMCGVNTRVDIHNINHDLGRPSQRHEIVALGNCHLFREYQLINRQLINNIETG